VSKKRKASGAELSLKHQRFVAEYLVDLNATQAAIRAGYSRKTANEQGARLLAKASIRAAIEKGQKRTLEKLEITQDRVIREIARLAFADPRKFFNDDGTAKSISQLDDDTAAALAGVEIFEEFAGKSDDRSLTGYTKKFKIADKRASLELLGRHLKLFTDKLEVAGDAMLAERLAAGRKRLQGCR
jgi:phage terminase small subunit